MRACDVIKNKLPSTSLIEKDSRYIKYLIISSIANKKATRELIAKHITLNIGDNSFVDEEALSFYLNINFDSNGKEEYILSKQEEDLYRLFHRLIKAINENSDASNEKLISKIMEKMDTNYEEALAYNYLYFKNNYNEKFSDLYLRSLYFDLLINYNNYKTQFENIRAKFNIIDKKEMFENLDDDIVENPLLSMLVTYSNTFEKKWLKRFDIVTLKDLLNNNYKLFSLIFCIEVNSYLRLLNDINAEKIKKIFIRFENFYDELDDKWVFIYNSRTKRVGTDRVLTLQEVGDEIGLTRERVRQIEAKIHKKINYIKINFDDLIAYVNHNISINESRSNLDNKKLKITPIAKNFFHPIVKSEIDLDDITQDNQRKTELNRIYENLKLEINTNMEYYLRLGIYERLQNNLKELKQILDIVISKFNHKNKCNKVRSLIKKHLDDYKIELDTKRTSEETERTQIVEEYDNFKKCIIDYIKLENKENIFPIFPNKMAGCSVKPYKNYEFKKHTAYHNADIKNEFYQYCFNSNYANEIAIKSINTKDLLSSALKNSSLKELNSFKLGRLEKFIAEWSKETTSISEITSQESIGNTPGEISLVYYKFLIQDSDKEFYVLAIDQPEDDINPKRIKDFLLKYLGSIRDKKQVILVTHNPLLVVNLDVDNVIYLTKENNEIKIKNGALEFENEEYSILDLIKNNLDGGYKAVERRLKVYERDED